MSTSVEKSYHHKDLRTSLITSGRNLLTSDRTFSLRAVAADSGVSPTATYRHFADRQALESAIAAEGYQELLICLQQASATVTSSDELWKVAIAYVDWAMENQAIFHLMFTTDCDPDAPERVEAVKQINDFLTNEVTRWYPARATPALLTATWALVQGLAVLHMEGKLPNADSEQVHRQVRAAWEAIYPAI